MTKKQPWEILSFLQISNKHCVFSLLIRFEEDVCTFLIFSYSFIGQQLLLQTVLLKSFVFLR